MTKQEKAEYDRMYRLRNKDKISQKKKEYRLKNREKIKKQNKERYAENKEMYSKRSKERYLKNREKTIEKAKDYYKRNKDEIAERKRVYRKNNKDKIAKRKREYREKNIDKIKKYTADNKEMLRKKKHEYYLENKDRLNRNLRMKRKTDSIYRIGRLLRSRMSIVLRKGEKKKSTEKLLGCSFEFFKEYIAKKFVKGMSWNNHGHKTWHLDHIKPCCAFDLSKESEQKKCFHYTNFQPLFAKDNLEKSWKWKEGKK